MFRSEEIERLYCQREARYLTALRGELPDRVPIRFFFQEVAGRYMGYTNQDVACDYARAFDATRTMAADLGCDAVMLNAIWSNYAVGKSASWRYLAIPGVDIGIEGAIQFSEPKEEDCFLRDGEYGEFCEDPTAFLLTKWLSRAATRVKPPGEKVDFYHNAALINGAIAFNNYMRSFGDYYNKLVYEAGVVSANSGMVKAPLDLLQDKLRGFVKTAFDIFERPDDVLRACEALMPHILANALASADGARKVPLTLWAHRGCVPFVSRETFDGLYWPTLKPILQEINNAGHQVIFYAEGKWEPHIDRIMELADNGIIYHVDRDDIFSVAGKLKGKFPVSGGIPYDLIKYGGLEDIGKFLDRIFAEVASEGGYILDSSALLLHDANIENLKFIADYTRERGVFSAGHSSAGRLPLPERSADGLIKHAGRRPNVCVPWEEESAAYASLSGDIGLVKSAWEDADRMAYNYAWTSLLW